MPLSRRLALAAAAALALVAGRVGAAPLAAEPGDMSLGRAKAPVQVVEYASASCIHCAHFAADVFPQLKAQYIDKGKVRFTLREFLTEPVDAAAAGFLTARCAGAGRYFIVLDQVFRSQSRWSTENVADVLRGIASANGVSEARFKACLSDQKAIDALNARIRRAEAAGVNATPTLFVNGELVDGPLMPAIDEALAKARASARRRR